MMDGLAIAGTAAGLQAREISPAALAQARDVRRISRATLERFGVVSSTQHFPELGRRSEAHVFPYLEGGQAVYWKAHAFPQKAFLSKKGGKAVLFNLDAVRGSETVYITEGEWDCLSLVEAGIPFEEVASVPGGAPEKEREDGRPYNYKWAEEAAEALSSAKRIVWCGDMDGPGLRLREALARIWGPARFWFVDWPEGCKDASDMLRSDGPRALADLVSNGALPWPVDGLFRLHDIPELPPLETWYAGFPEWGSRIRLAPGTTSILTGHPGHGKTSLFGQIWFQIAQTHNVGVAVATFETRAKPHYRKILRQFHAGKAEGEMNDAEKRAADNVVNDLYSWIIHPTGAPNLEWILDTAAAAVVRNGARVLQIDPWNRLETQRNPHETMTEYIGRCLRTIYQFATEFNVHVQIAAHPAKRGNLNRAEVPTLEDISDSKHWDNMTDQGFVVHRHKFWDDTSKSRCFEAELRHLKARFDDLGFPCSEWLRLNNRTWTYESCERPDYLGKAKP